MNLDALRSLLLSEGWLECIQPKLTEQQKAALNQLTVQPAGRAIPDGWSGPPSDDYLRGHFNGLSFALNHWQQLISQSEQLKAIADLEAQDAARPALGSPYADPTVDIPPQPE